MRRLMLFAQNNLLLTVHEATVVFGLSCLVLIGAIGRVIVPEPAATHAHVPPRALLQYLDSLDSRQAKDSDFVVRDTAQSLPQRPAGRINVNRASAAQLETIRGIGPATAKRIIETRNRRKFTSVEDLLDVKGIGKKKLDKMRPYIIAP